MRNAGVPEEDRLRRALLEQGFCLFQIDRVEAFGEPAVDRSKEIASPR